MAINTEDRPLESVREEVIDQLIMNYGHGTLSLEAFERRLDEAYNSKKHAVLKHLVADLELDIDTTYIQEKKESLGVGYQNNPSKNLDYIVHIFGGGERSGRWEAAKKIIMINIFGGGDIDFTDAKFSSPTVTVKLFCLFGGANIYVPKEVNISCKTICLFGSVNNKVLSTIDRNSPTVIIEGLVLFGSAAIKNKTALREKIIQFADSFKSLFVNNEK
ncbi:MAG: LiaF domain-containing protein [Oceanicoccus sp.]